MLDVLTRGGEGWSKFAWHGKTYTAAQIRKLLGAVKRAPRKRALDCAEKFLEASLDVSNDTALETTWRAALSVLDDIQKYPFDATKRGKKLRDIARSEHVLSAWQAAARAQELPSAVLALLIIDASEASLDALVPHFERALTDRDVLEAFEDLERYVSSRTAPLFARLKSHGAAERAQSPVLAFGERFGLAKSGRFKLKLELLATKPVKRFTYDFVTLSFDSHDTPGFALTTGQQTRTSNSSSMWQRGVKTSLEGLPKTLEKLARKANVEWDFAKAKPARASRLIRWLAES